LGAIFKGPFNILNEPGIPLNDSDTPPTTVVPSPSIPTGSPAQRIQAIANTAGFHFASGLVRPLRSACFVSRPFFVIIPTIQD